MSRRAPADERGTPHREDSKNPGRRENTGLGQEAMGEEQRKHLRRAILLEKIAIGYTFFTVTLIILVAGQSQAMKASWIEDALSIFPPLSFLIAIRIVRRTPHRGFPYGYHRSIGVAHLVAAIALLTMGAFLAYDSGMGLVKVERAPVGTMVLFGHSLWQGWIMIAALIVVAIPPMILGHLKMKVAKPLHDKVLFADADMDKANWTSSLATVVGVLGIGFGLWWLDPVAALFIAASIVRDGVKNLRAAIGGLVDAEARTYDDKEPHPLTRQIEERAAETPWVAQAVARVRDLGHLFHAEVFVVPREGQDPTAAQCEQLGEELRDLDWKVHDVVVASVPQIPPVQAFPDGGADAGTRADADADTKADAAAE